ncbi:MAG: DUF3105 domain-containing protein [Actinomycetes bacterium]
MANKSKQSAKERRAKVEEIKRAQARAERRKTMLFVGVAAFVGLGLIGAAVVPAVLQARNDPANKDPGQIGVPIARAGCGSVIDDKTTGAAEHVPPGTPVKYATVPPSSGKHYDVPLPFSRKFYTADDDPAVENLVHNLEHGYSVVWYDDTLKGKQLEALQDLSERIPQDRPKFIVAPWDEARGSLPAGKHVAMSVWGHRQLCAEPSGKAIADFSEEFPPSIAPEPNAA